MGLETVYTTTRKPSPLSFNTLLLTFEFGLFAGCVAEEPKEVYFSEFMHSDEPSSLTRNNSAQKAASNKENQKVIVGKTPVVTTVHSGGLLLQHTFASFNGGVDSDNMSNSSSSLSEMSDNIFRHHNGDNNSSDLMPASLLEGKKSQVIKEST